MERRIPREPDRSANLSVPSYVALDARVEEKGKNALLRIRRDGPSNYSCSMQWHLEPLAPGSGLTAIFHPVRGEFVFDFDVDEIVIPITIEGAFGETQSVRAVLTNLLTYNVSPTFKRQSAVLARAVEPAPPLAHGLVSRVWNEPIRRAVPPSWPRGFFSDLVKHFVCTSSGFDASGQPCFRNALAHGRAQFSNGEVGLYSDPATHGTNPLQMLGGKRLLIPEKLASPIVTTAGPNSKSATYSSPLVSTEMNNRLGYGRFEYRFALLHPQQGMWPAGWCLCLPPWRWPDCEQDTVEISFAKADPAQVFPYMTNWWRNEGNKPQNEGQFADVPTLLAGFDYGTPHTYWSEWTPERISWGIDEVLLFSAPNRFFMKDRSDPNDPNRLYMMLQIALGGAGGDCSKGAYPTAPSIYAEGNPAMLVEYMAHYSMPLA